MTQLTKIGESHQYNYSESTDYNEGCEFITVRCVQLPHGFDILLPPWKYDIGNHRE